MALNYIETMELPYIFFMVLNHEEDTGLGTARLYVAEFEVWGEVLISEYDKATRRLSAESFWITRSCVFYQ